MVTRKKVAAARKKVAKKKILQKKAAKKKTAGKKTTQKPKAKSKVMGRPTKYLPEYVQEVLPLCLAGLTDAELSVYFDISEQTLNEWKKKYPDFHESLKKGKSYADGQMAMSLYNRGLGYTQIEQKDVVLKGKDGQETVATLQTEKHIPADTTAIIFWLKNRRNTHWRDKHEFEHKGSDAFDLLLKRISDDGVEGPEHLRQ